jgi:lipopolysaccharide cholinephosphotransferase
MKLVDTDTFMKEEDTKEIKDLGVYLDIFPIDGYPNNKLIGKLHLKKLSFLKKSHYMAYTSTFSTSHKLLKPIKYLWFKCSSKIGARKLAFKTEKLAKKYKRSNCLIWANTSIGDPKELMPKAVFERIDNYKFNNENFTSMKNYDYYLTSMYGDYMKLPPKNQQVTHHHYIAYYKDSEDI